MSETIVVELHAQAADLAGVSEAGVPATAGTTGADVKRSLAGRFPRLAGLLASSVLATDREYLLDEADVAGLDRLHLIPPVSGG